MDNQIKQERGSEELSAAIVENGYSDGFAELIDNLLKQYEVEE